MTNIDIRNNIQTSYRLAYLDYKTATCKADQEHARREMLRLSRLAGEMYGFEFQDSLNAQIEALEVV